MLNQRIWGAACTLNEIHVKPIKYYPGGKEIYLIASISELVTNMVPLCSVDQVPSYEDSLTLLAKFLKKFAHLNMLFILEMAYTAGSAGHLKNK